MKPIRVLGKYELLEKIGSGGMAEVYMARLTGVEGFEKIVVVKRILPGYSRNISFIQMLIQEAKLTSGLQHPNIVQIFELDNIDNQYYIAMEYVDGKDLLKILARSAEKRIMMQPEIACYIAAEVCKGLHYAHRSRDIYGNPLNIIHRDVSPSNVIISWDGHVKIMDFGVAKAQREDSGGGRFVLRGKLGYMSPEQVRNEELDARSDVFSLGIVLFESVTLKRLFLGKSDIDTLINIRDVNIDRKLAKYSQIDEALKDILRKALARNRDERYSSAQDLQLALNDYLFQKGFRGDSVAVAKFIETLFFGDGAPDTVENSVPTESSSSRLSPGRSPLVMSPDDSGSTSQETDRVAEDNASFVGAGQPSTNETGSTHTVVEVPAGRIGDTGQQKVESRTDVSSQSWLDESTDSQAAPDARPAQRPEPSRPAPPERERQVRDRPGAQPESKKKQERWVAEDGDTARQAGVSSGEYALSDSGEYRVQPERQNREPPSRANSTQRAQQPVQPEPRRNDPYAAARSASSGPFAREPSTTRLPVDNIGPEPSSGSSVNAAVFNQETLEGREFRLKNTAGFVFGPVDYSNLVSLLQTGAVSEEEYVSIDGADWKKVREVTAVRTLSPNESLRVKGVSPVYSGTISKTGIVRVFFQVASRQLTGKLRFVRGSAQKEFYFNKGRPKHVASNLKQELLGPFLVQRGLVSHEQMEAALEKAGDYAGRLGDALVSMGYVKHHELYWLLDLQFKEKFTQIFAWDKGTYEFYENVPCPIEMAPSDANIYNYILDGIRKYVVLEELDPFFRPHAMAMVKAKKNPFITIDKLPLNSKEMRLWGAVQKYEVLMRVLKEAAPSAEGRLCLFQLLLVLYQLDLIQFVPPK